MMDDDEMEQVNHLVPSGTKARASESADWGELSEAVRSVYEAFARTGGDADVVRLQAELQRVQSHLSSLDEQIASLESEREAMKEREDELVRQLDKAESDADEYIDLINQLLDSLDSGESVWPSHAIVQEAATLNGSSPDEVIDELRDERPHLPDDRFTEGSSGGVRFAATEDK